MRILRRWDWCRCQDNVGKLICHANNPLSLTLITREEFQQILQLSRVLILQEALGATSLARMPTELGSSTVVLGLFADDKCVPSFMDERLMKETIDDPRVHPVALGHARFEMTRDMFDVSLASGMKS